MTDPSAAIAARRFRKSTIGFKWLAGEIGGANHLKVVAVEPVLDLEVVYVVPARHDRESSFEVWFASASFETVAPGDDVPMWTPRLRPRDEGE
jgi:hypothetical protein